MRLLRRIVSILIVICLVITISGVCAESAGSGNTDEAKGISSAQNKGVTAGDTLLFGTYPQTRGGNDCTPIEWIVLAREDDRALLISHYALDCRKYNSEPADVTWESCSLRTWLNSSFIPRAFTDAEQMCILNTAPDGKPLQDQVFLLSSAEVQEYFSKDKDRMCAPTEYAEKQGACISYYTTGGRATGWWWLSDPAADQNARVVRTDGSVGHYLVHSGYGSVRPVCWVGLNLLDALSGEGEEESGTGEEKPGMEVPADGIDASPDSSAYETSRIYSADSFTPGNRITFGTYPQTKEGTDKTPIEWLVLDRVGDSVMLISQYKLDMQPYNTADENASWETCSLRAWLNDSFLNTAFTADEQAALLESAADEKTKDRVTLLTPQDAKSYFDSKETRQAAMTKYTAMLLDRTGKTGGDISDIEDSMGWPYWLRNTGYKSNETVEVSWGCEVESLRDHASYSMNLIRPVIYINTDADLFRPEGGSRRPESPEPEKEYKVNAADYVIGNTVTFGSWPQTESGKDRTPIEWQVIGRGENRALLLSRYALDLLPFLTDGGTTTWEKSTLRAWLNEEFLNTAFSRAEQAQLLVTALDNTENAERGKTVNSGKNTLDRVFLLSYSDLKNYLHSEDARLCSPTAYAAKKMNDRFPKSSHETVDSIVGWWLRSVRYSQTQADVVRNDGSVISLLSSMNSNAYVRPAVWITLDPGSFTRFADAARSEDGLPEKILPGTETLSGNAADCLPEPESLQISGKKKIAIYSAPSTKSVRTQKNKAAYQPGDSVEVYGQADGWLMIRTVQGKGKTRIGYIRSKDLKVNLNAIGNLHFADLYAGVCKDTALYEAPDSGSEKIGDLSFGTETLYLASEGDWAYIETAAGSKIARGFVPCHDILLKRGNKLPPADFIWTSGTGEKTDAGKAADNDPGTALAVPVEEDPAGGNFVFTFESPVSLGRMVLWNGYWKTEKNKDQYEQYGRLDTVELSFLYEGSTDFSDPMLLTVPETKKWEKRSDGIYIDLTGHDRVTAVRITPVSMIKGKKYKTEIAVSEIAFYDR